jgi:hypothetical protein
LSPFLRTNKSVMLMFSVRPWAAGAAKAVARRAEATAKYFIVKVWRVVWVVGWVFGLLVVVRIGVVVGMMAQWRGFGEVLVLAVDCPERS